MYYTSTCCKACFIVKQSNKKAEKDLNICKCGNPMTDYSTCCKTCFHAKSKTKIDWPPIEELINLVESSSFLQISKQLGVSDNAIRKHMKYLGYLCKSKYSHNKSKL